MQRTRDQQRDGTFAVCRVTFVVPTVARVDSEPLECIPCQGKAKSLKINVKARSRPLLWLFSFLLGCYTLIYVLIQVNMLKILHS